MNVSCVIPTRGDCDLTEVLESLPFDDVIVYDNSKRDDLGIYARYAAIAEAKHDVIVTQDDDLIVSDWAAILRSYAPGVLTVSYPEPWDIPWVARGAIFDRHLPFVAFDRYLTSYPMDWFFTHNACDGVFALLTPEVRVLDFGSVDLPYGLAAGRVSTPADFGWYNDRRPLIRARCDELRLAA